MGTPEISEISDTAFWVSAYRAEETKRPDALFKDPFAELLAGEKGRDIARAMSDSRYSSWTVVVRTCVIDDMIDTLIRNGVRMVVNLGAGLDTRPYRLDVPEDIHWIEVDHPHLIEFKEEKLGAETPRCRLERIGADLSDRASRQNLFDWLNAYNVETLILTEGVIPYLTEDQVGDLAADLRENPNFSYWITEYHSKKLYKHQRSKKKNNEMGNSPFQFFPENWLEFFSKNGWLETETFYLNEKGKELGRPFPLPFWARAISPLLPKKEIEKIDKMLGFVLLRPVSIGSTDAAPAFL